MAIDQRRKFLCTFSVDDVNNIKVELSAKTTYHACAVDIMRGKPDAGNFSAWRSQGGPGGPGTPKRIPLKIINDKTCTH